MTDEQREERICELGELMVLADSSHRRLIYWREMQQLIAGRSLAQVHRMEQERGLENRS